jgi:hypothetical protein
MSSQEIPKILKSVFDAFNAHDLNQIMSYFDDDCILEMPRGPDPWGKRYVGKAAVREALSICRAARTRMWPTRPLPSRTS